MATSTSIKQAARKLMEQNDDLNYSTARMQAILNRSGNFNVNKDADVNPEMISSWYDIFGSFTHRDDNPASRVLVDISDNSTLAIWIDSYRMDYSTSLPDVMVTFQKTMEPDAKSYLPNYPVEGERFTWMKLELVGEELENDALRLSHDIINEFSFYDLDSYSPTNVIADEASNSIYFRIDGNAETISHVISILLDFVL